MSTTGDVYLPPGLLYAAPAPCVIRTILGSCVAVCLWSPTLRVGGMNHYLLPRGAARGGEASMRFGETALSLLLARLHSMGATGPELRARIYGGAAVLSDMSTGLGAENVAVARRFASDNGIPILDEDVLGRQARRVVFDIESGEADVACLRGE